MEANMISVMQIMNPFTTDRYHKLLPIGSVL